MLINKNLNYSNIFRSLALFAWAALLPFNVWSAEFDMKSFNVDEYANMENPTPGEVYRAEILTKEHAANDVAELGEVYRAEILTKEHAEWNLEYWLREIRFLTIIIRKENRF